MKSLFPILLPLLLPSLLLAETPHPAARAQAAVALAYQVVANTRPNLDPKVPLRPSAPPLGYVVSYRVAHDAYVAQRRPMVVLVSASWCPYCPAVKASLEAMRKEGRLQDASLVVLDYDADNQLAHQVLGTRRQLPFVALFTHDEEGPRVYRPVAASQLPGLLTR